MVKMSSCRKLPCLTAFGLESQTQGPTPRVRCLCPQGVGSRTLETRESKEPSGMWSPLFLSSVHESSGSYSESRSDGAGG